MLQHIVPNLKAPIRFNIYCEQNIALISSRKGIKKAIKKGELQLNDEIVEGGRYLQSGDVISLVDLEATPPKTYAKELAIIFEDEDLAVIIKPAGLTVSGNQFKTVQNALSYNLKPSTKLDKLPWPLPVHRLDNQTSGLLVIAKSRYARIELGRAFENKVVSKKYHALVIGETPLTGTIDSVIENKESTSHFKRLASSPSLKNKTLTLLELTPITGRTHQLRIHCSKSGFPILGDKIYGDEGMILKQKGLFLAAVAISFPHPITHEPLTFNCPTPKKFAVRMENEARRFEQKKSF